MTIGVRRATLVAFALVAAVVLILAPGRALAGETVPFPDLSGLDLPATDEPAPVPFPDLSGLDLPATDEPAPVLFPDLSGLDLPATDEPAPVLFPDLSGLDLPATDEPAPAPFPDLSGLDLPATDEPAPAPFPDLSGLDLPATDEPAPVLFPDLSGLDLPADTGEPVTEPDFGEPATVPFPDSSGLDLPGDTGEPVTEPEIGEPATVPFPDLSGLDLPATDEPAPVLFPDLSGIDLEESVADPPGPGPVEERPPIVQPPEETAPAADGSSIGLAGLRRSIVDTAREVRFPTITLAAAGIWLAVVAIGSLLIGRTRIMHSITGVKEGLLVPAYTKPGTAKGATVAFHFRHDTTKVWQRGFTEKHQGSRWMPVESPAGKVWIDASIMTRAHKRAAQLISERPEPGAATAVTHPDHIETELDGDTENELDGDPGNEITSDDA